MARATRNSQRAAADAEAVQTPPSASRPPSPYDPSKQPVPFPTFDDKAFEEQAPVQSSPRPRLSARQPLSVVADPPSASPIPVSSSNDPKTPSGTPFRRPPTGSMAKRQVLGDLMSPPPESPTPSATPFAEEDGEEEIDENTEPSRLIPVPYNPKYYHDRRFVVRSTNPLDPFWKNVRPPVHKALNGRPKEWTKVGYYQENEWDTDDNEYTPRPPRRPRLSTKTPKTGRNPAVLNEGESYQRNLKKLRIKPFKPIGNPYIRSRLGFAPLNEGKKLRLVEDNGKAQYWEGVESPKKPEADEQVQEIEAKVYKLPEDDDVEFDENGEPLPNPDIDPSTGLPTAEWLQEQVDELVLEAEKTAEEFKRVEGAKAELWGALMMENEELEENNRKMFELVMRAKKIVPPHVFKNMVYYMNRTDMDDPDNIYGPARQVQYNEGSTEVSEEEEDGEELVTDNDDSDDDDDDEGGDEGAAPKDGADILFQPQSTPRSANPTWGMKTSRKSAQASGSTTGTQSQRTTGPAATTSNQVNNNARKPKALTRTTNADRTALAESLAQFPPTAPPAAAPPAPAPSAPAPPATAPPATTSTQGKDAPKPKPLTRATYSQKMAFSDALAPLIQPSAPAATAPPAPAPAAPAPSAPATPATPPPATTSTQGNNARRPRPLTRATYSQKMAFADALAPLLPTPSPAPSSANANAAQKSEEDEKDTEESDAEEDADEEEQDEEENKPQVAAFQVYRDIPSPKSDGSDGGDADDEKSPARPKHAEPKEEDENEAPALAEEYDFDDMYSDEEGIWFPTAEDMAAQTAGASGSNVVVAQNGSASGSSSIVAQNADASGSNVVAQNTAATDEKQEAEPTKAAPAQTTSFQVYTDEPGPSQKNAEEKSAPKRAPLGPKRVPSFLPKRDLKRDRDESDERPEHSGDENNKNENLWVPKKRRVSGSYGTQDENTPRISESQAENDLNNEYEADEFSENRPLSPISERPSSEEREDEEVEAMLSFIESPRPSPELLGEASVSAHLDWFGSEDDVEMTDHSDEENDGTTAPVLPAPAPIPPVAPAPVPAPVIAPAPAPVIAPLLPAPVIVSTNGQAARRTLRPRPLRRNETMWFGD